MIAKSADIPAAPSEAGRVLLRGRPLSFESAGAWLAAIPVVFAVNLMFFLPDGDDLIFWAMLPTIVHGLIGRWRSKNWQDFGHQPLLAPVTIYAAVLIAWYLALGGFSSTIRAFVYVGLFLYFSAPYLQRLAWLKHTFVFAGFQLLIMAGYQHHVVGIPRVGGFTNPIFFGMFGFSVATINLFLFADARSATLRFAFGTAVLCAFYAVALSQSRGVAIAAIAVAPLYALYAFRQATSRQKAWTPILLIALGGAMLVASDGLRSRFDDAVAEFDAWVRQLEQPKKSTQENGVGYRLFIWRFTWNEYLQAPLTGLGRTGFEQARANLLESGSIAESQRELFRVSHAHNQYLQELVMRGIPGLLAMTLLFFVILRMGYRLRDREPWAAYATISLALAFLVFGLTEVTLKHPYKMYTLLMLSFALQLMSLQPRPIHDQGK